jgi:hypothetical protein
MNNDFNLNTRTLIVSFVFALMVLVPLRFVEINNVAFDPMVLGESIEAPAPRLEAPFDVVDSTADCLDSEYVDKVIEVLLEDSKTMGIAKTEIEIANFESRRCN